MTDTHDTAALVARVKAALDGTLEEIGAQIGDTVKPYPSLFGHRAYVISRIEAGKYYDDKVATNSLQYIHDGNWTVVCRRSDKTPARGSTPTTLDPTALAAMLAEAEQRGREAEREACAHLLDEAALEFDADAKRFRGGSDPHHERLAISLRYKSDAATIRARGQKEGGV
jgi:hypothetical protein